jgi:hygromycin-B 4-O-kinase
MLVLLDKCPEERYLVHGGYGYNNVLAQDGRVTAVLDWIDAMYGDFVYDFAVLNQWPPPGIDYPELLYQYYTNRGVSLPNFKQRLNCYQLYKGLDGMRFFAKTKNQQAYQSTRQKLENLLSSL